MSVAKTAQISEKTKLYVPPPDKFHIGDFCVISVPELILSEGAQIDAGSKIVGDEKVVIGKYSVISYDCLLLTSADDPREAFASDYLPAEKRKRKTAPIAIGENVFVGSKSIIMPGVTVYDGAVIMPNSYIDSNVEDNKIRFANGKMEERKCGDKK